MDLLYNEKPFDILTYLNDIYMVKMAPEIDVKHAGGYHNRHQNNDTEDKEILEINKKRIHIPNAEIKYFSLGQQENFEEYNEPKTSSIKYKSTKQNGKRYNEVSNETEQERSTSGNITQEVITL